MKAIRIHAHGGPESLRFEDGWIRDGRLKLRIGLELPLRDAVEAHRALEGRQTTGKVLLLP